MPIELGSVQSLNGAICERTEAGQVRIQTHPAVGGYSAFIPLAQAHPQPTTFAVTLRVQTGGIGVSAISHRDELVSERVAWEGAEQTVRVRVSDPNTIRGLLIRNFNPLKEHSLCLIIGVTAATDSRPLISLPPTDTKAHIHLPLRRYQSSTTDDERDGRYMVTELGLALDRTVAVVVDAWADHEIRGLAERLDQNVRDKLRPALDALRTAGVRIVHAPHDRVIHPAAVPAPGEPVIEGDFGESVVVGDLKSAGVENIIYLGYASNYCVLLRGIGILNTYRHFRVVLVRDASIAVETDETMNAQWTHRVMTNLIETHFGYTVSVSELQHGISRLR